MTHKPTIIYSGVFQPFSSRGTFQKNFMIRRNPKSAFHRFGQAEFPDGGSVLSSRQFSILPQLPLNTMLSLKVVKIDSKNKQLASLI